MTNTRLLSENILTDPMCYREYSGRSCIGLTSVTNEVSGVIRQSMMSFKFKLDVMGQFSKPEQKIEDMSKIIMELNVYAYDDIYVREWCIDVLKCLAEGNRTLNFLDEISINLIDMFISDMTGPRILRYI